MSGAIRGHDFIILSTIVALAGSVVTALAGCSSGISRTGNATGGSVGAGGASRGGAIDNSSATGSDGSIGTVGVAITGNDVRIGGDASVASSAANGRVVVNASVPAFDVRVYLLDTP